MRKHVCDTIPVEFDTPDEEELRIQAERVFRVAQDVFGTDHLLCGEFVNSCVQQLRSSRHCEWRGLRGVGFGGKIKASSREQITSFWFSCYPEDGNDERDLKFAKAQECLYTLRHTQ